mgnify:CR=1 FL=1
MSTKSDPLILAHSRVFKALAHPTRLFIVRTVAERPYSVLELTELVGDDISTVSRHLAVLRNAGVIIEKREGNQIFHSLRMRCVLSFFSCVDTALADRDRRRSNE